MATIARNTALQEIREKVVAGERLDLDDGITLLDDVARLVKMVTARMPEAADDLTRLAILTQVFYKDLGFGMNANDYYAPENSYIFDVLRTRRGIPISLAVIWLELAQALDLQAQGISFPGHFLVKVALEGGLVVLDKRQEFFGDDASPEELRAAVRDALTAPLLSFRAPT